MTSALQDRIKELEEKVVQLEKLQLKNGKKGGDMSELGNLGQAVIPSHISMSATRVVMHQMIYPAITDDLGICFGGQVLSWIDICAGLASKNAARAACVTAGLDAVHFLRPCRSGCVAIICAMVNRTFSSSMEVGVRVEAEDIRTGAREHCCSAYLTFVSLKTRGKPGERQLPEMVPNSPEEINCFKAANARRQARLEKRKLMKADEALAANESLARLQPIHQEGGPTLAPAIRIDPSEKLQTREASPSVTTAHMTQLIMPQHANSLGITFGGQVLSWMEECAVISASRLRGSHMLVASLDTMTFARPTKVGNIIYINSQVSAVFNTSMEVMVTVYGEDFIDGSTFHCADAYTTVACVDATGQPSRIPIVLKPTTEAELARNQGASERRDARLVARNALRYELKSKRSLDGHIWGED